MSATIASPPVRQAQRILALSKRWPVLAVLVLAVVTLAVTGCSPRQNVTPPAHPLETAAPGPAKAWEDILFMPDRGFFMGILPHPRPGQSPADAYREALQYADFVPVQGRPTPFYNLAEDLAGDWGQTFVQTHIRGNGKFPLVQVSFLGPDLTLAAPPEMTGASLSDQEWRAAYKGAVLEVVRTSMPPLPGGGQRGQPLV